MPAPPPGEPGFRQGDHLCYYVAGAQVVAYFPRYARLDLDLARGAVTGALTRHALTTYGVFEDLVAIALGPFLRRRGMFPVHALAAEHDGQALLLVGERGSGKTTTGLSLLRAGWKLLSNDAPLLAFAGECVDVLRYPGLLSAYPDTLARFPELQALVPPGHPAARKLSFAAESVYADVWCERAPAALVCFPHVARTLEHALVPLPAPEVLRRLLPNAVDRWDEPTIAPHFAALGALARQARGFELRLGTDTGTLAALIGERVKG
jgi:hypothetical protein